MPQNTPIFFDLDDTLVQTDAFKVARERFFNMMEILGAPRSRVSEVLTAIELDLVTDGFFKEVFPLALETACKAIAKEFGITIEDHHLNSASTFGWSAVNAESQLMDGALEALRVLYDRGHPMYIVTKGDPEIQRRKIEDAGIEAFFREVYVFPHKTETEIAAAVFHAGWRPRDAWFVGNSKRSDINPSLKLGMKVAYLPCYTWAFEEDDLLEGVPCHEIDHISKLPSLIG